MNFKSSSNSVRSKRKEWVVCLASTLLVCTLMSLVIIGLRHLGYLEFLELASYDYFLRLHTPLISSESRMILVTITEQDIQKMGHWPLTDATLARILEIILSYQPSVIGLDIYRDMPVPPGKEQLTQVFSDYSNIVSVKKIGHKNAPGISAPYILKDPDLVGFNDILVDPDGIVRRGILFMDDGQNYTASFSLLLSLLYLEQEGIIPQPDVKQPQHLRLGKTTFSPLESNDGGYIRADARGYQFLLNFRAGRAPFKKITLTALLSEKTDPEEMQDKIVMIGVIAESVQDFFHTPLNRGLQNDQRTYGLELHAHMVSQMIHAGIAGTGTIKSLNDGYEWGWILLWGILGGILVFIRRPSLLQFSLLMISGLFFQGLISFSLFSLHWWIPLIPNVSAWFLSGAFVNTYLFHQEKVQKANLMQLFSKHVSEDIANIIWDQRDQFMDGRKTRSKKLFATVLFTDLKDFTGISERLDPDILIHWLNEFMGVMAQIVSVHGGVVNKYIGDGIMAVFGVPVARTSQEEIGQDAFNAVNCALDMSKEIERLNALWQIRNLPTTQMRIGIFTGPLVAGCIGSNQRMEYTVIGDTVNIASRLEGFQKDMADSDLDPCGCRIFIGDSVFKLIGHRFHIKLVGASTIRGRGKPITIYRVIRHLDQKVMDP